MYRHLYKTYVLCLFLLLAVIAKTNAETPYTKGAKVTNVKQNWEFNSNHEFIRMDDTITVTVIGGKNNGLPYEVKTEKNIYNIDDLVEVSMNDNGTINCFTDDEITNIRKVGK